MIYLIGSLDDSTEVMSWDVGEMISHCLTHLALRTQPVFVIPTNGTMSASFSPTPSCLRPYTVYTEVDMGCQPP